MIGFAHEELDYVIVVGMGGRLDIPRLSARSDRAITFDWLLDHVALLGA